MSDQMQSIGSPGIEMEEFDTLFPVGYEVDVNGHRFVLKPFTLKHLRTVTETCEGLVKKFTVLYMGSRDAGEHSDMKFIEGVPELVLEFVDDVTLLIALSLRTEKSYVEDNLTGVVASRMLLGILEINDIDEILKNFQTAFQTLLPAAPVEESETDSETTESEPATESAETIVEEATEPEVVQEPAG